MNDGMYTNIRNYLEEIAGQQRQILAEQKRTNELLAARSSDVQIATQVKAAMATTLEEIAGAPEDKPVTRKADIHFDDGTKITHQKTADAFVTGTEQPDVAAKPKTAAKKPAKKNDPKPDVSPQVNWNS